MPIRLIFICGREPEYPRNAVILKSLRRIYDVIEISDHISFLPLRYLILIFKLFIHTRKKHDLIFIGFQGHILVFFARLFSKKPIILDAFISVYDTFCFDRMKFSPNSIMGKLTFWIDKKGTTIADIVCLDTQNHAQYYHNTFGIAKDKLQVFPVGCDEEIFFPMNGSQVDPIILYIGNFLPLHGVDIIMKAAKYLEGKSSLKFLFIGNGVDYKRVVGLANQLKLKNVEFHPPVPIYDLPKYICRSTICLGGHFGESDKAKRVIAGKTYLSLAMGKPTIVGDNPANRELLSHGYDAWFCSMNNSDALAEAIITLENNFVLRKIIGENGYKTFIEKGSLQYISNQIIQIINKIINDN